MNHSRFDAIVFDIGGVLVELTGVAQMLSWTNPRLTPDELWARWLASPIVRTFETGRCTADEFATEVCREFSLTVTPAVFLHYFIGWPRGLFPHARDLLKALPSYFTLATLSNTNAPHWQRLHHEMDFLHLFAHHWPSHETGLIKPDHAAFEQVVTALGIPPHRIVYVDDNQQNVDQACAVGLEAYRTVGLTAVMTKFTALGILENHL